MASPTAQKIIAIEKTVTILRDPKNYTMPWEATWEVPRLVMRQREQVKKHRQGPLFLFPQEDMRWRRKWQPTLVFSPGESQGQRSLVGCCLWGHTELDMTEAT